MKAAYYIRILPHRILAITAEKFPLQVGVTQQQFWHPIDAWNKYHAKQLGMEMRKVLKELEQ